MALGQEHAPVAYGDLDVGQQHAADAATHVRLEMTLVEQHVEQHPHQVDGVFFLVGQPEIVAPHAHAARTGEHFAAQVFGQRGVGVVERALQRRRRVRLHHRQHREQVAAAQAPPARMALGAVQVAAP